MNKSNRLNSRGKNYVSYKIIKFLDFWGCKDFTIQANNWKFLLFSVKSVRHNRTKILSSKLFVYIKGDGEIYLSPLPV